MCLCPLWQRGYRAKDCAWWEHGRSVNAQAFSLLLLSSPNSQICFGWKIIGSGFGSSLMPMDWRHKPDWLCCTLSIYGSLWQKSWMNHIIPLSWGCYTTVCQFNQFSSFSLPGSFNKNLLVPPCEQRFSWLIQHFFCQSVSSMISPVITLWPPP